MLTPLFTLLFIAVLIVGAQNLSDRRARAKAKKHHFAFVDLVAQFERVTVKMNHIGLLLEQSRDNTVAAYYEKCLSLFEQLLEMVSRAPRFGFDPVSIRAASLMASQCEDKVDRTLISLLGIRSGHEVDVPFLFGMVKDRFKSLQGCFFCTRPFRLRDFGLTKTRIKGVKLLVVACHVCRKKLDESKKAEVVFLENDGAKVHWTQHPGFQSDSRFWRINEEAKLATSEKEDGVATKTVEIFD